MKRKIFSTLFALVLVLALVNPWPASAQDDEFQLAPINPEALEPPSPYGYRPPTMDLSHLEGISAQEAMALLAQQPSSWDWRDYGKVTLVKDQETCGTCWAFGTTSVLESAVLLDESAGYDFSEQSVALCVDRSWVYLYDESDEPCNGGGDSFKASEVFIKKGAVLESCKPYDTDGLQCDGTCACDDCPPVKKVTGYRYVTNDGSQIALIKAAVSDRPVTMSFYYDSSAVHTDVTYGTIYDYYPCTEYANHIVSIIGWDDSVPHPDLDHDGTGAWLVKNSWGTGWGNSGYFWLAYDSSSVGEIAYLEYGDYNANETLYYWDEAGWVNSAGYASDYAWMANVFTVVQGGNLTNVDFWATSNNAQYGIYVYNDGNPSDGLQNQLTSQSGTCQEAGYYSIALASPVSLSVSQQFTIAVKMTTPGYNYPIPVEYKLTGTCDPPIQTSVSYARHEDGGSWADLAPSYNACLRAKIYSPPTYVTTIHIVDKDSDNAVSQITFPAAATGATVSSPYNDYNGSGDPQLLSDTDSSPVVRLYNASSGDLEVHLQIDGWTNGVVTSERYKLVTDGTNVNEVDDVLSSTGSANTVDTNVTIANGDYLDLYLEVVLGSTPGLSGGSTLTILGEIP